MKRDFHIIRVLGGLELAIGSVMVALCTLLIVIPFIAPDPRGDLDMFGLMGGIILSPLALSIFIAGRAFWKRGWSDVRLQLLPVSAFLFAVIGFWWVDRGSLIGPLGDIIAFLGFISCIFLGAQALGIPGRLLSWFCEKRS
jgi:hypothetical protein